MSDTELTLWIMVLALWTVDLGVCLWIINHLHRHRVQYGPRHKLNEWPPE